MSDGALIAVLVAVCVPFLVSFLKGHYWKSISGLILLFILVRIPFLNIIGLFLIGFATYRSFTWAKPGSIWARLFYDEGQTQQAAAHHAPVEAGEAPEGGVPPSDPLVGQPGGAEADFVRHQPSSADEPAAEDAPSEGPGSSHQGDATGQALESPDAELRVELDRLERELFEVRDDIEPLRAKLSAFERHYLRTVGPYLVRLAELQAQAAELRARQDEQDEEAAAEAEELRDRAERLEEEARQAGEAEPEEDPEREPPSKSLSELRRTAAKLFHPDLAEDEEDRKRREKFMKEANSAFAERSAERLQAVIDDWLAEEEPQEGGTSGEFIEKLRRKVKRAEQAVENARRELSELRRSDLYFLMKDSEMAEAEGRSLLDEMIDGLEAEISTLHEQISGMEPA